MTKRLRNSGEPPLEFRSAKYIPPPRGLALLIPDTLTIRSSPPTADARRYVMIIIKHPRGISRDTLAGVNYYAAYGSRKPRRGRGTAAE